MHKERKTFGFPLFVHATLTYMYKRQYISAFTLIEILVVIAIIGVLSSIVLMSISQARAHSRDKARISDLAQIQLALKLYSVQNGTYQVAGAGWKDRGAGFLTLQYDQWSYHKSVSRALVEQGFLASLIFDPLVQDEGQAYLHGHHTYMIYPAVGGWTAGVCLFAELENPNSIQLDTMNDPRIPPSTKNYVSNIPMNYAQCM